MSIYRCHVLDIIWTFAKFLSFKSKAYDKRFPYIAVLSSFPCPHGQFNTACGFGAGGCHRLLAWHRQTPLPTAIRNGGSENPPQIISYFVE